MTIFTAGEARANSCRLMDQTAQSHEPVFITGNRSGAVLVFEGDWKSIQ